MEYSVDGFLAKNDDSLRAEWDAALRGATNPIVAGSCAVPSDPTAAAAGSNGAPARGSSPATKGGGGGGSSFATVGGKFVKSLRALMAELGASDAHFIRCVRAGRQCVGGGVRQREGHAAARLTKG